MDTNISSAKIVQDLLHIHNDRIKIYSQALQSSKGMDLDIRSILERIIEESTKFRQQLNGKILEEVKDDGQIYKAWAGVKAKPLGVTGVSRKKILENCINDELAVLNAYSMALSSAKGNDVKEFLTDQQQHLRQLHAHISKYHDAQ